ncbi:MAG: porin [Nitrospirota bacterium]|nr:porin [Nitrospirota bacterium]
MIGDLLMKISFHEKPDCRMPGGFLILGIALLVTFGESSLSDAAVLSKEDFKLYGYVDASYTQNFNNPRNSGPNANALRIFDGDSNSFRPNMAQLVFEKEGTLGTTAVEQAGFRIKLDFGEDAQFTGGRTGDDFDVQEMYAQYVAPVGNGLDIRIGRMNTLVGYEVIESPLNLNFSRSWLFGLGQPFTTTGIRLTYPVNEMLVVSVGAINSFTGLTADTNSAKSVEGLVSFKPFDQVGVNVYGIFGREGSNSAGTGQRVLVGSYVTFQATEQLGFVVEGYYANQAKGSAVSTAGNARWDGAAGYVIYDFDDQWGLRVRGEIFEDAGGDLSCLGTPGSGGNANACFGGVGGFAQTLWETTVTLQYKPVPSLITRLEFRYDKSNRNVFVDERSPANNQQTLAAEAIFLF